MDEPLNGPNRSAGEVSTLLMRHRTSLLAFILASVRNYHDAEDILQELCTVACQKADQFRPGTNFQAWARTIAVRTMLSYRRRHGKAVAIDPQLIEGLDRAAEQRESEGRAVTERIEALNRCLARLQPRLRTLLKYRYVQQLSIESIAERLGQRVEAMYKSLLRTRLSLRECIQRQLRNT